MSDSQVIEWGWIKYDLEQELELLCEEDEAAKDEAFDRAGRIAEITAELNSWDEGCRT